MGVVYERCCGLDGHQRRVVACLLTPEGRETRSLGTMTPDLLALAQWSEEGQVTHLAMESTGVYWQPVYNLLEDWFTVLVLNARHIKAVAGRKVAGEALSLGRIASGFDGPPSAAAPGQSPGPPGLPGPRG